MPIFDPPVRDYQFLMHEFLDLQQYRELPRFEDADPEILDAVLEEGGRLCREVFLPLNLSGDQEGCHWDDTVVTTPKGFPEAYRTYVEGGWPGLTSDPEYGGQGLPHVVGLSMQEMVSAANMSFGMYPGLSHGAYEAIHAHGSDEQKRIYLPKLVSGEWTGTMNLTEAHCGTDLGMIRTRAEPQDDGSYRISGSKIFISAGEHDLSGNIVHLVLARIPGSPEGTRGISLFVVPKYLVNEDGSTGERNGVSCGSIEHKMGIKASATCVMNYDGAAGYLVGEENQGLPQMFTMMNAARLGTGIQALGVATVAYQNAADYARERLQGRSLSGPKAPDRPADPLIVHPDIRRMLMTGRAFIEGARALALFTGLRLDLSGLHPEEETREAADDWVALLTPVIKAYFTDMGFEIANLGMQVMGGAGYIAEWGMEQFARDVRITQIYEGTNGIQALDLVGRKLAMKGGRLVGRFYDELNGFIGENRDSDEAGEMIAALEVAEGHLQQATDWIARNGIGNPEEAGGAASDYLRLFALVAMGYTWARMALAAGARLADGTDEPSFYRNKLATARYFFRRMLPDTGALLARVTAGVDSLTALPDEAF
ncbi:MAG TPA: acyl-CoA dehydrogenase C-terminal domain-containing protein [Gammaproteobacteria bacterium]|nr:acyl-CoA dehydrogenase C-terminal domain-containing protein [Gammaproteobacteria bacterium]